MNFNICLELVRVKLLMSMLQLIWIKMNKMTANSRCPTLFLTSLYRTLKIAQFSRNLTLGRVLKIMTLLFMILATINPNRMIKIVPKYWQAVSTWWDTHSQFIMQIAKLMVAVLAILITRTPSLLTLNWLMKVFSNVYNHKQVCQTWGSYWYHL